MELAKMPPSVQVQFWLTGSCRCRPREAQNANSSARMQQLRKAKEPGSRFVEFFEPNYARLRECGVECPLSRKMASRFESRSATCEETRFGAEVLLGAQYVAGSMPKPKSVRPRLLGLEIGLDFRSMFASGDTRIQLNRRRWPCRTETIER